MGDPTTPDGGLVPGPRREQRRRRLLSNRLHTFRFAAREVLRTRPRCRRRDWRRPPLSPGWRRLHCRGPELDVAFPRLDGAARRISVPCLTAVIRPRSGGAVAFSCCHIRLGARVLEPQPFARPGDRILRTASHPSAERSISGGVGGYDTALAGCAAACPSGLRQLSLAADHRTQGALRPIWPGMALAERPLPHSGGRDGNLDRRPLPCGATRLDRAVSYIRIRTRLAASIAEIRVTLAHPRTPIEAPARKRRRPNQGPE